MKVYRGEVHGNLIEARLSELGSEQVLLNGREVSSRSLAVLRPGSHFFDITDESGKTRHVEVRRQDISKLGLGRYRIVISVDGVERCRLEPIDTRRPPDVCGNCGYQLRGQPIESGEIKCPECGRHTSAAALGRVDEPPADGQPA
jgi:hypothetical protein